MSDIYSEYKFKRSRAAYTAQCAFEYLITLLVMDAFLANLLSYIGISDAVTGVISSFISFAFLFQLLSIFLVRRIKNTKRTVIIYNCLSQLLFMLIYLIPFAPVSKGAKTSMAIIFIMLAYISNYMVSGVLFNWANSFVRPAERAEYSSVKEIISLVSGIIFTIAVGYIIDRFQDIGNMEGGFLFSACTVFIINVCNFICLSLIERKSGTDCNESSGASVAEIVKNTFGNKSFRSVVVMTVIWYAARYMTEGFLGTYKIKELAISVGAVQLINIIGNAGRIAVSLPFGKFSDKKSYAVGMKLAFFILAAAYLSSAVTAPKTRWLIIAYTLLYNMSMAGLSMNSFNIVYSYVDRRYVVEAMAIKNSIGGLCGFLISIIAGRILHYVQAAGNTFFGLHIYGQQLLSAISFILMLCAALYVRLVIEKQHVMLQ